MPDGDLILSLQFDDAGPDFEMGSCGRELYRALAPLAYDDEHSGWPLAHLCEALGRMRQPISDLVRAWSEPGVAALSGISDEGRAHQPVVVTMARSGWSRAAHPSRAPGREGEIDLLPFVGQLAGVRGIEPLDDDARREAIKRRDGYVRGQPESVRSFALGFTDGEGVVVRERYNPSLGIGVDAPHHGRVIVKRSRIRNLARVNLVPNARAAVGTDLMASVMSVASSFTAVTLTRETCSWHSGTPYCFQLTGTHRDAVFADRLSLAITAGGTRGVPVEPDKPYVVSGYVTVTDPTTDLSFERGIGWAVQWYNAAGAALTFEQGPTIADELAPDTRLSATFLAPPAAAYAQFQLGLTSGTPLDTVALQATALMVEQNETPSGFGDADTPSWESLGERYASPSRSPGITVADLAARILARIPAGLIYDVVISDERDWTDVSQRWSTWDDVETVGTWDDLINY
ncbi:MAG TPA: hypothetical protein VLK58_09215 [Conexibacter sp.]|nr:hypothetical protein [Conexibacter sp.]